MFEKTDRLIKYLTRIMAEISGWVMFSAMALVTLNVILRTFFNRPVLGTLEWVEILTSVTISFGLAYCAYTGSHIAIDFIVEKIKHKPKKIISVIYTFLSTVFMSGVTLSIFDYAGKLAKSGQVSPTTKIPFYIFVYITGIGFSALVFVLFIDFIKSIRRKADNGNK